MVAAGAAELDLEVLTGVALVEVDGAMEDDGAGMELDEVGMTGALATGKEEAVITRDSNVFDASSVEDEAIEVVVGTIVDDAITVDVGTTDPAAVVVLPALHALFPFNPLLPLIPLLLKCLFNTSTSANPPWL